MKKEEKETAFICRSYGKSELASLYLPTILPASATKEFNKWIASFPGLAAQLAATGLGKKSKRYIPAQVRMIVDALGEP